MPEKSIPYRSILLIIVLFGLAASATGIYATRLGPWAKSDSSVYLASAINVLRGGGVGVVQPSGHLILASAPIYPLLLAGLGKLGIPLLDAARWLDVALLGTTIFLAGFCFYRLSRSPWLAAPASLLLLAFPWTIYHSLGLMTEPLFLALEVVSILLLGLYLDSGQRAWLVCAGAAISLGALTRLIGFAFLPVGLLVPLLLQPAAWKRRLMDALLFLLPAALILLAWWFWYQAGPDHAALLQLPPLSRLWGLTRPVRSSLVDVIWGWIPFGSRLPRLAYGLKSLALGGSPGFLIGLCAWGCARLYRANFKSWLADQDLRLFLISWASLSAYILLFAIIFVSRNPPQDIDDRTLLPLYPLIVFMGLSACSLLARSLTRSKPIQVAAMALPWAILVIGIAAYLPESMAMVRVLHFDGGGYTNVAWRDSQIIPALKALPADTLLISNDTGAVLFFTGRMGLEINETNQDKHVTEFTRFGDAPGDDTQRLFRERKAALVLFSPAFHWSMVKLYAEKADERTSAFLQGLEMRGNYRDGQIYYYPQQ